MTLLDSILFGLTEREIESIDSKLNYYADDAEEFEELIPWFTGDAVSIKQLTKLVNKTKNERGITC